MHAQKSAILGVSAAIAALVAAVPADAGTNATSPSATPTVGELSAAWWQWALSIPAGANPLGDGTGELCGVGQHGDVWFLAGTLDGSPANRSCRVPAGTKILFPAINAECSVVEDASLQSRAALRSCAKGFMDLVTEATASVDERTVKVVRTRSPLFSITLPPGNVLGIENPTPNPSRAFADGFWVLLEPLRQGEHSIAARGLLVFPDGSTFEQELNYAIEIVAPSFDNPAAVPEALVPSGAIPLAVIPAPGE